MSAPRRMSGRIAVNLLGAVVFVIAVFPVFWMVSTSIKTNGEITGATPHVIPYHPTGENYRFIFEVGVGGSPFWLYLRNSLILALSAVVITAFAALLAATAVARFRFRGKAVVLVMLLIVQMIPCEALVIPLFLMVKEVGLYDKLPGVIAVYVGTTLPFAIWMLRGFVAAVPRELEEAAAIDGAGWFRTFWRILFPLVAPGLVATSIFSFISAWNDLVFALTLLGDSHYTMPVALEYFFGRDTNNWGAIMAASTLMTIPVIVFFLFVQRRMVTGLTSGAVKG
ncbi:MAG TPA: carbohydrate ABC transporter permease [Streptosporangiaceae bacterium]|jgi:N,N'-diacetylchitobiose transport system permease protein